MAKNGKVIPWVIALIIAPIPSNKNTFFSFMWFKTLIAVTYITNHD